MKILFKKILYTLVLSVGLISVSSCADYLDVSDEIADNLSLEDVFENKGYVQKWHANIFNKFWKTFLSALYKGLWENYPFLR